MGATGSAGGNFVISLDYELMWGVRDHATRESYGRMCWAHGRRSPRSRPLPRRAIRATWAIVGALLCENKDELLARATHAARKGAEIARAGGYRSGRAARSILFRRQPRRLIAACPGQEIGSILSRIAARSSRARRGGLFPPMSPAPSRSSGTGASNANRSSFPAINTAPNNLRLAARLD